MNNIKILATSTRIPQIGKTGDSVLMFNRLVYAARFSKVTVLAFRSNDQDADRNAVSILNQHDIDVFLVRRSIFESFLNMILMLVYPTAPLQCAYYKSKAYSREFKRLVRDFNPDLIYCSLIRIFLNVDQDALPVYIDFVDSLSMNFARRAQDCTYILRWFYNRESFYTRKYEIYVLSRVEKATVVSALDANYISKGSFEVLPLGVSVRDGLPSNSKDKKTLVFVGNMHYEPNETAILWFLDHCWASIKSHFEDVKIVVVGNNPTKSLLNIASTDASIIVTGGVDSVWDYLQNATISIAPMQTGSGMQFKILEAMACALPVVTTTLGLGDIKALDGKEILVANSPDSFVSCILMLLRSNEISNDIGIAANDFVRKNHSWSAINEIFWRPLFIR